MRQVTKTPETNYYREKERLNQEKIESQELQIAFFKEKLARIEVKYDNEKKELSRKVQNLE